MKKKNYDAMHHEIFGSGMDMDIDMEGEGVKDWIKNLYNVIRRPSDALTGMPKKIRDFTDEYGGWNVVSWSVCREPLSSGLQRVIDFATRGQLLKNKDKLNYDDIFHLYSDIYLKDPKTGKTKAIRLDKNARVNIGSVVPYKKGGKCMGVGNIPKNLVFDTLINKDTDKTTWQYSSERFNCQDYTSKRLEAVGLLTEPLRNFIMQDVPALLPDAKIQLQLAKGVTNIASIFENIMQGGELEGEGHCGCGMKGGQTENHYHMLSGPYSDATGRPFDPWMYAQQTAGKGKKKGKGFAQPHKHDPQTWEVQPQYLEPNWWNYNRDYK